ncbi:MAG: PilZ domain-containing protein [Candidatus Aceula meridiana]|nr:PilZ domain-containing protein [Candidatus Aceula meridiana]
MVDWKGLERRQFPRVNYPCLVTVRQEGQDIDAVLTHTENIGTGGLCIIFKRHIKLFAETDLELDLLDMEKNIKGKGKVVWSVKTQSKKQPKEVVYDTGIEFSSISPQDQKRITEAVRQLIKEGYKETPQTP